MLAGTPWRGENRVSPLPGAEEKDGPQTVTITPGAQGARRGSPGAFTAGGPPLRDAAQPVTTTPGAQVHAGAAQGHSQQEGPH